MPDPKPGDYFVVSRVAASKKLTDRFLAHEIAVTTLSHWTHAGTLIDRGGVTVEAEAGGVRFGHIRDLKGLPVAWNDQEPKTDYQRTQICTRAQWQVATGIKYNFADLLALFGHLRFGLPTNRMWPLSEEIADRRVMICSQSVADAQNAGGIILRPDKHWYEVTPSDLGLRITTRAWEPSWESSF